MYSTLGSKKIARVGNGKHRYVLGSAQQTGSMIVCSLIAVCCLLESSTEQHLRAQSYVLMQ